MIGIYKWGWGDNSSSVAFWGWVEAVSGKGDLFSKFVIEGRVYRFSQALGHAGVIDVGQPSVVINLNHRSSGIELVSKPEIKITRTDNQILKSAVSQTQVRISREKLLPDRISKENHLDVVDKADKPKKTVTGLSANTIVKN